MDGVASSLHLQIVWTQPLIEHTDRTCSIFLGKIFQYKPWDGLFDSRLDRIFFALFVLAAAGLWRVDRGLALLALPLGLLPAMSVSFMAYSRYLAVVIPFVVFYGLLLARLSRLSHLIAPVLLFLSLAVQMIFLLLFINNHWVA